ncbi:MAG: prepilin-type N-terminal cleavage/methylation domain-containing protein [Chloroflexi bacterium]|nr:prepilin-type N-terminal cleavage/methylation domain-containing protein [Chloroflexota bacterium]
MKKLCQDKGGFTLVEVLVAIGLLAMLAGIAVPVVTNLRGGAQTDAAATELSMVQSAVDTLMADQKLSTLPNPVTTATNDMSRFPGWQTASPYGYVLYPSTNYRNSDADKFVRKSTTKGTYTCSADGTVTQATTGY